MTKASTAHIPQDYHSITPNIIVKGAEKYLEFLVTAFEGKEIYRMQGANGSIGHAEVKIGNSRVMLGEATEKMKPTQGSFYLYVEDADASYKRALEYGAVSIMKPADQFYGDRHGGVKDPAGNQWWIAARVEEVSEQEMNKRAEQWRKDNPPAESAT